MNFSLLLTYFEAYCCVAQSQTPPHQFEGRKIILNQVFQLVQRSHPEFRRERVAQQFELVAAFVPLLPQVSLFIEKLLDR